MRNVVLRALCAAALGLVVVPGARADSSLGSWTSVAPMGSPRFGAAAATLPNGDVLVAGGQDASGNTLSSAEIYDPSTNAWGPTASMSTPRLYAAAVTLSNGDVLVAGGVDGSGAALASTEMFDPTSDSWSPGQPMPTARFMAGGVQTTVQGDTTIAGGTGDPSDRSTAAVYLPDVGSDYYWYTETFGPANIIGAAMAPDQWGGIFEAGGADTSNGAVVSTVVDGNPNGLPVTSPLPTMRTARYLATAATLPDKQILVAGGASSTSGAPTLASAEIYDQVTQAWSPAATMPVPVYGAASAALPNGHVLVVGGSDAGQPTDASEVFTPSPQPPPPITGLNVSDQSASPPSYVRVGDELLARAGTSADAAVQFEWERCRVTCTQILDWTESDTSSPQVFYTVTSADIGASLRVVMTATDAYGTTVVTSQPIGPVDQPGFHLETLSIPLGMFARGSPFAAIGSTAPINVVRDDAAGSGSVHYTVWQPNPGAYAQFKPISGVLDFPPGASAETIEVPVFDHGVPILAPELDVALSDPSPLPLVPPSSGTQAIYNGPISEYTRNPLNPLALAATPPRGNPLAGAKLFVDRTGTAVSKAETALKASDPTEAALLDEIVDEPGVTRFGTWNGNYPGAAVQSFLQRAYLQEPGTVPLLATYKLVDSHITHPLCGRWADPPTTQAEYHEWITNLAEGIGAQPAVLFLEMDSLITVGCLSPEGLKIRLHELSDAINVLQDDPHLVIYLDAGAADAVPATRMAHLLEQAGISKIQGFFLNSTHFDWTSKEIKYGEEISKLTGGKHFVINTAENGQGPLVPKNRAKNGNEILCNPPGRGLGPLPTTHTHHRNLDAFAWIANPGVSGGICGPGQPAGGEFSIPLALNLVKHANFKVR